MTSESFLGEAQPRWAIDVAQLYPPQGRWTEAAYLVLPDTNRLIELAEGNLVMTPHPTNIHQQIVATIYRHLYAFVEAHDLGIVRFAPLPVRLWQGRIREPDILFLSHAHADRIGEQVFGPPDLAVEVTSPGTRVSDRREKIIEYARAGIPEYWIVDPDERVVDVFILHEGTYDLLGRWHPGEAVRSSLWDTFSVEVSALFTE